MRALANAVARLARAAKDQGWPDAVRVGQVARQVREALTPPPSRPGPVVPEPIAVQTPKPAPRVPLYICAKEPLSDSKHELVKGEPFENQARPNIRHWYAAYNFPEKQAMSLPLNQLPWV